MFYVYVLYSQKRDVFYKGYTSNIKRRLSEHNQGSSTFTSTGRPWKLIWCAIKFSKRDAMELELKLKNLNKERLFNLIRKYDGYQTYSFSELKNL